MVISQMAKLIPDLWLQMTRRSQLYLLSRSRPLVDMNYLSNYIQAYSDCIVVIISNLTLTQYILTFRYGATEQFLPNFIRCQKLDWLFDFS